MYVVSLANELLEMLIKVTFTFFLVMGFSCYFSLAKEIVISRNFVLFTSRNLENYLKPLFTTFEQSLNSNLFGTNFPDKKWLVSLNIAFPTMIIPNAQKKFNAEVPDGYLFDDNKVLVAQLRDGKLICYVYQPNLQPTIFGGSSTPIFSSPQTHSYPDSIYKSVAYPEGISVDLVPGMPVLQCVIAIPSLSEVRFRFLTFPFQGESLIYYTLVFQQRVDKLFGLFQFDKAKAINFFVAFHSLYRQTSLNLTSYSFGFNIMQKFGNKFLGYLSLQYENLNGHFTALKDTTGIYEDVVNSPFPELRQARPIEINISSFTKFQFKSGLTWYLSIFNLNLELSFASQPMFSVGFSINLFQNEP